MKNMAIIVTVLILIAAAFAANWYMNRGNYEPAAFWQASNESNSNVIDHQRWQNVLDDFLISDDPSGVNLVDYQGLLDEPETLTDYLSAMTQLDPRDYSRAEQFAYWVNLYNALTMNLIIENYPTKSITKISESGLSFGPWDDAVTTVAGQSLTLNDIEHRILRAFWKDHRIHFAVNCASIGCPNVQASAFTSANTSALLDTAAVSYLRHPRGLKLEGNELVLSSIFDWYKSDFGATEQEVINTLSQYLDADLSDKIAAHTGKISYDYDWALNQEQ